MKRQLAGALLAVSLMVSFGALAPAAGASATGPRTWHVLIGGHADGQAIQAEGYYPHVITIDAGDTVVWTLDTKELHAVAFAGTCEDVSCIPPDCFAVNIDVSPCGPPSYDGVAAFDSSGRMVPPGYNWDNSVPHGGRTFSLTFTNPGANVYFDLSYAGMRGVVVVHPAGTPYPFTQAQYSAQARDQLAADLAAGARAGHGSPRATPGPGGTHTRSVAVGASFPGKSEGCPRRGRRLGGAGARAAERAGRGGLAGPGDHGPPQALWPGTGQRARGPDSPRRVRRASPDLHQTRHLPLPRRRRRCPGNAGKGDSGAVAPPWHPPGFPSAMTRLVPAASAVPAP